MKKRIISLLLCAAMLLSLAPIALAEEAPQNIAPEGEMSFAEQMAEGGETEKAPLSLAALDSSPEGGAIEPAETEEPLLGAASGTCGENLTWSLDDDGTLTISGTGDMENYDKDFINGAWITSAPWRQCFNSIRTILIGDGITGVGNYAFCGTHTNSVHLPSSISNIGNCAFDGCSKLTEITIPNGVTTIGDYAFRGCSSLTSVTIPDSVTSIGHYAFDGCSSLVKLIFGSGLQALGNAAFSGCSSLTRVTLPYGLLAINSEVFSSCTKLARITIPDSVTSIGGSVFSGCSSLTSITIPDSVTSIGGSAFQNCTALTSITIPDSVTSIGDSAFGNCTALASITIPDSVTSIGTRAFARSGLTQIIIPDSVTTFGSAAFYECSNLQSAVIGNGATVLGYSRNYNWGMFQNCTALTDVTLGRNIVTIDNATFHGCTALQTIKIPENTVRINDSAFSGCSALESIAIPDMTVQIGASAFSGCSALSDVYYGGTEEDWTYITIGSGNDALTGATLHVTDVPHTHSYDSGVVKAEPTCTKAGVKVYTCAECGDSYTEAIPATGHAWDHGVITLQPTLTETGVRTYTCQNDAAHTYTEILPVLNSDAPTLSIIGGKAQPGKTVAVSLTLANNPGIAGMRLCLAYDSVLTLTNVETADALSDLTFTQPGDLTANPVTLFWDGLDADDASGTILTLFFTVAAGTADGEYPITVTYTSGEIYDGSMQDVTLAIKNGVVTVKNYILGDANGDDLVNGKDVTILRQFLAGGYDVTIDELAADANRDGKANGKDVTMLRQYLAGGYGITLE